MSVQVNLKNVTLFSQLSGEALEEVSSLLKGRDLAEGQILFNQGDAGDELIIVDQGSVAIFIPQAGSPSLGQSIRVFQPGEVLGEMALLDQKPRSTSARAEKPSRIMSLSGGDFRRILQQNPAMALSVMAGLSDRIRYTTDFLGEVRSWVRIIAEGNYQSSSGIEGGKYGDKTLAALAAEFAQMAARVQQREETLRREVAQLRIQIDEVRRKQEADRIMGSEYFKSLKEKAKAMRQQQEE